MKMHIIAKQAEKLVVDNAPVLLTGIAVVGTITTGYLAARGGMAATTKLDVSHIQNGDRPTGMDAVKLVWSDYLPAIGAASATIACIVCANHISTKRVAAMATAYSLSEKKLKEYKEQIEKKFGLEKAEEVDKAVVSKQMRTRGGTEAIILGADEVVCFDSYSGRYFKSSMEGIRGAANDTNFEVIHSKYATLTFFWDLLGLEATAYSDDFGWTHDCPLELQFTTMMSSDDRPALCVTYDVDAMRRWNHTGY